MSDPKHTPGPWMVGYWGGRCHKLSHQGGTHPGKRGDDPCVYDPEFTPGAYGIGATDGKMVIDVNYDELVMSSADARLIAAAPDLLAALEALTEDRLFYVEGDTSGSMNVTVVAYESARAAIAKATS